MIGQAKNKWFLLSSRAPQYTQPCVIPHALIRTPVDKRSLKVSHTMKACRGTLWGNQTRLLHDTSSPPFAYLIPSSQCRKVVFVYVNIVSPLCSVLQWTWCRLLCILNLIIDSSIQFGKYFVLTPEIFYHFRWDVGNFMLSMFFWWILIKFNVTCYEKDGLFSPKNTKIEERFSKRLYTLCFYFFSKCNKNHIYFDKQLC